MLINFLTVYTLDIIYNLFLHTFFDALKKNNALVNNCPKTSCTHACNLDYQSCNLFYAKFGCRSNGKVSLKHLSNAASTYS